MTAAPAPAAATYQHPETAGNRRIKSNNLKILSFIVLLSPFVSEPSNKAIRNQYKAAALFTVTALATQIVPTAALVVLRAPVAFSAAATLEISQHLLMMTVAMSASSSFAGPLSHPAHLLVMGPGGYRFTDYVKVGVPLTVVTMAVCVWLLPILWPP